MKIGVLTFHRCINYGSYWQTRCLVEEMQKRGHNVVILDHQSKRVDIAEWKCALQPVLPTQVPKSDYPLYRKKIDKFFEAFGSLPLSNAFPLEHPAQMDEYEIVIVGSDEVWNLSHPWYGYYPIFYGDGIRSKRLISYAASFGNYDVTWKPDQEWINKLHRFEKISVRDKNSQTIIKNILGFKPEIVMDPCLQFPIFLKETDIPVQKRYAAVYGHNFSEFFIKNIVKWAHYKNITLISIGYRNDWADEQWLTAGPIEFASFIACSECVITNFFHGCIFSVLNSKPFISETSSYRNHKIRDLLEKIEGEDHLISQESRFRDYKACLEKPLEEKIFINITKLRNSSDKWLTDALGQNIFTYV